MLMGLEATDWEKGGQVIIGPFVDIEILPGNLTIGYLPYGEEYPETVDAVRAMVEAFPELVQDESLLLEGSIGKFEYTSLFVFPWSDKEKFLARGHKFLGKDSE